MTTPDITITALRAEVERLRAALADLVRLVDHGEEDDAPPYLYDLVMDRARAALNDQPEIREKEV